MSPEGKGEIAFEWATVLLAAAKLGKVRALSEAGQLSKAESLTEIGKARKLAATAEKMAGQTDDVANAARKIVKAADDLEDVVNAPSNVYRPIATQYGEAVQDLSQAALNARTQVAEGAKLYRIGTTGKSHGVEAQFWSLEPPTTPGFAQRYGIPPENVAKANFVEVGTLKPGTNFVTRRAPGVGGNPGGGIEVVVPESGVRVESFSAGR